MFIHEAVKKAKETDGVIYRESQKRPESEMYAMIKPSNSYEVCKVIVYKCGIPEVMTRAWKPTEDDLAADDWNVCPGPKKAELENKNVSNEGTNKREQEKHEDFFMKLKLEREGRIFSMYLNGMKLRGIKEYEIRHGNEGNSTAELELHMDVQLEAKIENHTFL